MENSIVVTIILAVLCLFASVSSEVADADPEVKCPQGHFYKSACNYCICDPQEGELLCTKARCGNPERSLCPHGERYTKECNTCWCDPVSGNSACTKRGCIQLK